MKKNILIILALVSSVASYAQKNEYTISGYVKDAETKETLIGVTIIADNNRGTVSNEYGFYSFNSSEKDIILTYDYIGYKSKAVELSLSSDTTVNILLKNAAMKLDEVLVFSKPAKFSNTKRYGSVSVNSAQLKFVPSFLGEQDIFKYFQLQPGVSAGKEGSSGMNLRGGGSDQTLILMDDIPIYNHSHAFGFVSVFSGEFIKSAELFKGYTPSNYGGRLSGVATLNIREGNRVEHKQSIQLGTTTMSGLIEGPINGGKGSYLVGGRYFVPDLLLRATYATLSDKDATLPRFGFYDVTAKASYDLWEGTTIYANFYTGRDAINVSSSDTEETGTGDEYRTLSETNINWGSIASSVRLSSQLTNKLFLNTTLYYSYLSNQVESSYRDLTTDYNHSSDVTSQMHEVGLKMFFQQNVNSWYKLSYGLNFAAQSFAPQNTLYDRNGLETRTTYEDRSLLTNTIFLDNKFTANKFEFNVGGRISLYNNNSVSKIVVEPRISISYNKDNSSLWVSYTRNTQPLFSMNQYLYSLPIDYWIPFHDVNSLPSSDQISLGYKYNFDSGLELFAETYIKQSRNISLIYNRDDFMLDGTGYELAKGNAYGFELMAQYRKNRFNFMGSYTYAKSNYDVNGKDIVFMYDTPHNLNLFAAYDVLKKVGRKHTFSMNLSYKTGLPYIMSNETYPVVGTFDDWYNTINNNPLYSNARLNNFFRVDLNYTMEKKLKKGSRVWQISLLNATGHNNPYAVYTSEGQYKAFNLIPILPSFSYIRYF